MRDLNPNDLLNEVSLDDKQKLWLPSFYFGNSLGKVDMSMIDSKINLQMETEPFTRGKLEEATEG